MKYLLLSILIITFASSKVIIDLENKGREGSDFLKNAKWVKDKQVKDPIEITNPETQSETNKDTKFTLPENPKEMTGFYTSTPTMKLTLADGTEDLKYNLSSDPNDKCVLLNYPKAKRDAAINCTYSNGYSALTKQLPNRNSKKELSLGRHVISLNQKGSFDVGVIQNGQVVYDESLLSDKDKESLKNFEGLIIKDFFMNPWVYTANAGFIAVLTEDELIIAEYINNDKLELVIPKRNETFSLRDMRMNLTGLKDVLSYHGTDYILVLNDSFYMLTKPQFTWEANNIDKLVIRGEEVALKDINAIVYDIHICITIKGYGLVVMNKENMANVQVFEHKYMIGIVPSSIFLDFGVIIDNQGDESVKEFFIEFKLAGSIQTPDFELNRVFISSQKVKAIQTDLRDYVIMFLMDTGAYIVPRSFNEFNTLPVYVYKNIEHVLDIGFINVVNKDEKLITFSFTKSENSDLITLSKKLTDTESFTCNFKEDKSYLLKISREYLNRSNFKTNKEIISYPVKVTKSQDKKKDDDDKTEGGNTVLIIIIVAVSVVVVLAAIAIVCYIKKKKRQAALMGSGNYQLSA
jgi:hypothetical protein